MGSQDLSYDGSNFDKGLDISFEPQEPKSLAEMSKREIVSDGLSGTVRGVGKSLTNGSKWIDAVRNELPGPFKETWKTFDETSNSLADLQRKATKEVKPLLGQMAKTLDNLVPASFQRTKAATGFLKEKFYEAPGNRQQSPEEIKNAATESMLGEVFKGLEHGPEAPVPESDREKKAKKIRKVADTVVSDQIEKDRHDQSIKLFSRIDSNIQKLSLYQEKVTVSVERKGLELSFRKYTLLADIFQQLRNSEVRQTNQLSAITTNTSLPETKKIQLSDRFKENAKRRLTDSLHNKVFGKDSIIEKARAKLSADATEKIEEFKRGLELGLMGLDAAGDAGEMISSTGDTAVKAGGDFGGQWIGDKVRTNVIKKVMPEFNNDSEFQKNAYKTGTMAINPNYALDKVKGSETYKNLADGEYGYQVEGFFDYFRSLFSTSKGDKSLEGGYSFKGALDPENQTKRLNTVQMEVVPGYLARILREVTMHRTGKEEVELVEFDPTSGKFSSSAVIKANVERILNDEASKNYGITDIKNLTTTIKKEMGLKEESDEAIVKLITSLMESNKVLEGKSIRGSKAYETGTEAHRKVYDKISERLEGDTLEKHRLTYKYEEGIKNVRKNLESGGSIVQQIIDAGLQEPLLELGVIVKDKNGALSLNEDQARERVERTAIAPSDVELKKDFKGFSGKKALAGIKNLAISAWKYKDQLKGKGQKIGPMAQDLHKELGEEIAPGGKKVDLVSANGTNMAAIQELAKGQDEIKKELHGEEKVSTALRGNKKWKQTDYLNAINENLIDLHETLKKKSFGFGMDMGSFKLPDVNLGSLKMPDVDLKAVKDKAKGLVDPLIKTGNKYIDMVQSLLLSGIRDGGNAIIGGLGSAKDGMRNFWEKNKEGFKDKKDWLLKKVVSLTGTALNFGRDVLLKHIPAGFANLTTMLAKIKDKTKVLLNGPVDVYIQGNTSPILLATRMRAGVYACSKTGKIIKGVDDLLAAGCDIIDISNNNEVALRWSDSANGLFDQNGKPLKTLTGMVTNLALGAASWVGKKMVAGYKWATEGPSFLTGLKETLSSFSKSVSSFFNDKLGFSFTDVRQLTLLAQIRDLTAIGKEKKLLDQVYNRDLKDEKHLSGNSFLSALLGDDFSGFMETLKGTDEDKKEEGTEGTEKPPEPAKTEGGGKLTSLTDKIKKLQDFVKDKGGIKGTISEMTSGIAGSDSFVGPLRPGEVENGVKGYFDRGLGRAKKGLLKIPGSGLVSKLFKKKEEASDPTTTESAGDVSNPEVLGSEPTQENAEGFFKRNLAKAKDTIKDLNKTWKEKSLKTQEGGSASENEIRGIDEKDVKKPFDLTGLGTKIFKGFGSKLDQLIKVTTLKKQDSQEDSLDEEDSKPKGKLSSFSSKSKAIIKDAKEGKSLKGLLLDLLSSKNKSTSGTEEASETTSKQSWGGKLLGKVRALRKPKETPQSTNEPAPSETETPPVNKPSWKDRFNWGRKAPTSEGVGAGEPKVGMVKGLMNKAKGINYKGLLGGAGSLVGKGLGMLFSGGGAPTGASELHEGTALANVNEKVSTVRGVGDGSKGKPSFNDKDGDGERDGGSTEQLRHFETENQTRKEKDAAKAAESAKIAQADSLRYKSSENALTGLIGGAASLIGMLSSGAGSLFKMTTSVLSKIPGLGTMLKWGSKAVGSVLGAGKNLAVGAARGVAGAYATGGITGIAKAGAGIALRGLGVATTVGLASGSVLGASTGAAALILRVGLMALGGPIGATLTALYVGYKAYKYFTRNNVNDFEKLRVVQYGLTEESKDIHKVMELEGYLLDGKISYAKGVASINTQAVKPEELLEIMDIDKENKDKANAFNTWFVQRFQPFFLNHLTALYVVDPKMKLGDVEKLEFEPLGRYLEAAQFLSGPYDVLSSPFVSTETLKNTKEDIPKLIESLKNTKKPKDTSGKKKLTADITNNPDSLKNIDDKKKQQAEALKAIEDKKLELPEVKPVSPYAPNIPSVSSGEKIVAVGLAGDDGGAGVKEMQASLGGTYASKEGSALASRLNAASGPLFSSVEGAPFISVEKGVKIDGLNPSMKRNLFAMAAEYGQLTGLKLKINSGYRTNADQAALSLTNKFAAKPGTSMHEFGLAVDIDRSITAKLETLGLLRKYGFTRPVGGEPWHVEPAGIQLNHQLAKKDVAWATQQIEASPGRGGGGIGSTPGGNLKGRNPALAKAILEKASDNVVDPKAKGGEGSTTKGLTSLTALPQATPASVGTGSATATEGSAVAASPNLWKNKTSKIDTPTAVGSLATPNLGFTGEGEKSPSVSTSPKPIKGYTAEFGSTASNDKTFANPKQAGNVEKTKDIIAKAAERAGMDPKLMQLIAAKESSMGQNLKSGNSSATGPFQFMPETWAEQMKAHSSKYGLDPNTSSMDVNASTLMTAEYLKTNTKLIQKFKPTPDVVDYYLSHMLGGGGVQTLLRMQPEEFGASKLPNAAKNNVDIFYKDGKGKSQPRTVKEIREFLVGNFNKLSRDFGVNLQLDPGKVGNLAKNMGVTSPASQGPIGISPDTSMAKPPNQKAVTGSSSLLKTSMGSNTPAETLAPSYDSPYSNPTPLPKQTYEEKKPQQETLRGQPEIASGVTAILQRGLDAEEKLLSVVQNDMVPVLQRMYDTLEKIYTQGGGMSKGGVVSATGDAKTAQPSARPGNIMTSTQSVLDRVRKYG